MLLGLFAVMAVTDAAVCQIQTDQKGDCLLPCICCHVAGVIHTSPVILVEHVTAYVHTLVTTAPALLTFTIFHPPRA